MTASKVERGTVSADDLEAVVASYRHLQGEHRSAQPESSHRRRLEGRLAELERKLTGLLLESGAADEERRAWLERLRHGSESPAAPGEEAGMLVFAGESGSGSRLELRHRPDGAYDVLLDGRREERLEARRREALAGGSFGEEGRFHFGEHTYRETFAVSEEALSALRASVEDPSRALPWGASAELIADGLVDRHLSLTARGRRALGR